jgi:hypothetical protein
MRAFAPSALALVAGVLATGCVVEEQATLTGYRPRAVSSCPVVSSAAANFNIDANDTTSIATTPGEGVGVFVDYDPGGTWHIWTVCDTTLSQALCTYDVTAQVVGGTVANVVGDNLEPGDAAGSTCTDSVFLSVDTGSDTDEVRFSTSPGAPVQISAWLDGMLQSADLPLIYWAEGDAARNDGSDPITLTPTAL